MLVVSRKLGETVIVNEQIEITIFRIGSNGVRLGIKAPAHMVIRREELPPNVVELPEGTDIDPDTLAALAGV